ncbi:MAG: NAD(+)/NADH kinase [Planctomycetes bacterium]|nr:NAD(+)/NADH kinase [Planctomycetota bacterium]
MVSVLVVGDERKGGSRRLVETHAEWLRQRVARVHVVLERSAPLADIEAEYVVVFGGDGSLLSTVRRLGTAQKPILGINLGRLGFLTAFGPREVEAGLAALLDGRLHEESRLLLESFVVRRDGSRTESVLTVNDGVLTRGPSSSIITLAAQHDGQEIAVYSGDGLIVATPVGSTAYSLAAGGPILEPDLDALVLTPLASHALTVRPLVVHLQSAVEVLVQEAGGHEPVSFTVDGQVTLPLAEGDKVRIVPSTVRFRHLTRGPGQFFRILRDKLGWSDLPRARSQRRG